ncbi:MAG: DUF3368 domain-containing protein [Nitrospirae bacterium]|nr:MAG: DUF3368 domain-containing protein [Nitrospirota bacterium]
MPLVISDASPLIALAKIRQLHILKKLWPEIIIPEAVYKEVVIEGREKPEVEIIEEGCKVWIKVIPVKNRPEVEALQAILDEGEAEVIALGQEMKADLLLLDNREPRIFARNLNLKIIGTIGIVRLAWQKGLIKEPLEEINKLKSKGFWISDQLFEQIKKEIVKIKSSNHP